MGAIIDKVKGKAKQIEGRLTGDKLRTAQGTVEKKKGDVKGIGQRTSARVKAGVRRAKAKVQRGTARARAGAKTRTR